MPERTQAAVAMFPLSRFLGMMVVEVLCDVEVEAVEVV